MIVRPFYLSLSGHLKGEEPVTFGPKENKREKGMVDKYSDSPTVPGEPEKIHQFYTSNQSVNLKRWT